jgi:hypothetical protein
MDRRDGWLGYVAVALGALALLVALLGSGGAPRVEITVPMSGSGQVPDVVPAVPTVPAPTVVPPAPRTADPALPPLPPRAAVPPELDAAREAERRQTETLREHFRSRQHGNPIPPFAAAREEVIVSHEYNRWNAFWGPMALAGMVLTLGMAILMIGFGVRLLRGRGDGRGNTPPPSGPPTMA